MERAGVYDLGEVEKAPPPGMGSAEEWSGSRKANGGGRKRGVSMSTGYVRSSGTSDRLAWVPPSLSIILPGSGQFLAGYHAAGLFFLSSIGFLAAFAWAINDSMGRLAGVLPWLGLPPQVAFWFLPIVWMGVAGLHVLGVLHAYAISAGESVSPHPFAAGFVSLLVPGWGQILNGAVWRAGFFLTGVWIMAGVAWLALPVGARLLANVGLSPLLKGTPPWVAPTMLAVPIVVWILAAYDAAACAAGRRR